MNQGSTIFSQIFSWVSKYEFDKCVKRYEGNYKVQKFTCWEQFLVMSFAQLTYRESLRDIEVCLNAVGSKLYHSGIKSKIAKSTLADANEIRDWRIYADFGRLLIQEARSLYANDEEFKMNLKNMIYAFDSTTIDLCMKLFPWAKFRRRKSAVKMHTLLDVRGCIPIQVDVTTGAVHDVNMLDALTLEAGAFYLLDRGYVDYERLYQIESAKSFFVTRAKDNFAFQRLYSKPVNKSKGVMCDQIIVLKGFYAAKDYPAKFRRIKYYDAENDRTLVFLTNNFKLSALTVAELYRQRWKVELFFKWLKQHLRIKAFYGTSPNAVNTQIWIALCSYLLVCILKKKMKLKPSIYTILQILSISLFEKIPIQQAFQIHQNEKSNNVPCNQLILFE
jgi:hypothetical protein